MGNIMKCGMRRHNITSNFFHLCGCNMTVSCMQSIAVQETARLAIHFLNEQNNGCYRSHRSAAARILRMYKLAGCSSAHPAAQVELFICNFLINF